MEYSGQTFVKGIFLGPDPVDYPDRGSSGAQDSGYTEDEGRGSKCEDGRLHQSLVMLLILPLFFLLRPR